VDAQLDAIRWRAVDAIASKLLFVLDGLGVERPQESDRLADSGLFGLRGDDEDVVVFSDAFDQRFEAFREKKTVIVGNQYFHRETWLRPDLYRMRTTYFAYQSPI